MAYLLPMAKNNEAKSIDVSMYKPCYESRALGALLGVIYVAD